MSLAPASTFAAALVTAASIFFPSPVVAQPQAVRCPMSADEVIQLACSKSSDAEKLNSLSKTGIGFRADLAFISTLGNSCGKAAEPFVRTLLNAPVRRCGRPSILRFQADSASINAGESTGIKWSVSYATRVRIDPGLGVLDPEGRQTIAPDQTTTYTLTAEGPGGSATSLITVTVIPAPPPVIVSFQGSPETVTKGSASVLRWSVKDANTVQISPGLGSLPLSGERSVFPDQNTAYTLTTEGRGGRISSALTVFVAEPPVINFTVDPLIVSRGQTPNLQWSVRGADRVIMDPDQQTVAASGSLFPRLYQTTRFVIRAEGTGGTAQREVTVVVSNPGPSTGQISWTGVVRGSQTVTIDRGKADVGLLNGSLPGSRCTITPVDASHVAILSPPVAQTSYQRMVMRVTGNGRMNVVLQWSLQ